MDITSFDRKSQFKSKANVLQYCKFINKRETEADKDTSSKQSTMTRGLGAYIRFCWINIMKNVRYWDN